MCLITTHFFPKISFKSIKVYKVVIEDMNEKIRTPHQGSRLLKRAKGIFFFPKKHYGNFMVEGGMIHAFRTKKDAHEFAMSYLIHFGSHIKDTKVITAYIPPFTRYYIGQDWDICAKRMRYETLDC